MSMINVVEQPIRLPITTFEEATALAKQIQIAIPFTHSVNPKLVDYMVHWRAAGIDVAPYHNTGGFLEIVRANIAHNFLKTHKNYLVMVDSDVLPNQMEAPLILASDDKPVVAGVLPIFHPIAGIIPNFQIEHNGELMWANPNIGVKVPRQGIGEVAWAGTGIMCIKRFVLENLEKKGFTPFFINEEDRKEAAKDGIIGLTEDRTFCEQVKQAGYGVFIDFDVKGKHQKNEWFSLPEEIFE